MYNINLVKMSAYVYSHVLKMLNDLEKTGNLLNLTKSYLQKILIEEMEIIAILDQATQPTCPKHLRPIQKGYKYVGQLEIPLYIKSLQNGINVCRPMIRRKHYVNRKVVTKQQERYVWRIVKKNRLSLRNMMAAQADFKHGRIIKKNFNFKLFLLLK